MRRTPIRLALAITDLHVGGAERCLVELATRLDPRRFMPAVYCLGARPEENQATLVNQLEKTGIPLHFLGARSALSAPRVLGQLVRLLREHRPHLLQTFLLHANVLGAIAAHRAGVPKVVAGIRVAERRRWHLWLARWTSPLVDRHVCVSESVAKFSHDVGRLPENKLLVIPNGVDMERFASASPCPLDQLGIPPGRRVITFVGRLDRQKGIRWLLGLAPRLLDRQPNHDLLIVGDGPQRRELQDSCLREDIAGRVHFALWRQDVPSILAASDLLVLPSLWEGMPNVVLEAMACGRPVVATDVEGVRELLGPASSSQVVPVGDSQGLINTVLTILNQSSLGQLLGSQNRQRVSEEFSLPTMVSAYERLYESLADSEE